MKGIMRKIVIQRIIFIIAIVCLISIGGCAENNNKSLTPNHDESPADKSTGLRELIELMPSTTEWFTSINNTAIREDPYLKDIIRGGSPQLELISIDSNEIDFYAIVSFGGLKGVTFVQGSFAPNTLISQISGNMSINEYDGRQFWSSTLPVDNGDIYIGSRQIFIFALKDAMVFSNYKEDIISIIDTINHKRSSISDDQNFNDVIKKLPHGVGIMCTRNQFTEPWRFDGLILFGETGVAIDKCTISTTLVFKFEDTNSASNAMEAIEAHPAVFEGGNFENLNVIQDRQIVVATAQESVQDYFGQSQ